MKNKKNTGSFYTPKSIADFLVSYLSDKLQGKENISVLEPSAGDGNFIRAIYNHKLLSGKIKQVVAVEKVKKELDKINVDEASYKGTNADFLKYQKTNKQKFSVILGNPPYIKAKLLESTQIKICEEIQKQAGLSEKSIKNIWPAFLLSCSLLLENDGILAFVLPTELLQVKFSEELQVFLKKQFERTEIFTFDDLLFDCKGQDTILLVAFKQHKQKGQYFTHVKKLEQLAERNFVLAKNTALSVTGLKWSHHFLAEEEITFIHRLGAQLKNMNHYCDSKPGIVTASNDFFIVDKDNEETFGLAQYAKPVIQKGLFVNGSVVFNKKDYESLIADGRRAKVLAFTDEDVQLLHEGVEAYKEMGESLGLHKRYKCELRKNWLVIPNISDVPEGFFFKRTHSYPKLLKNNADVRVTDSAYKIEMRNGYRINHLIYSFYNTLTLTFAELNGRYYGGGVLELTPSEFKRLPIPYLTIDSREFNKYTRVFERKSEIKDILNLHDSKILNTALNLNSEEIEKIGSIYSKLISKRFRI